MACAQRRTMVRFGLLLVLCASGCGSGPASRVEDASPAIDAAAPAPHDWRGDVLYLIMIDRFADGPDDDATLRRGCYDPDEDGRFHGGDLEGLRARLDYLEDLGVTALWTTPVYRQSRCGGYHGYWPDFAASGAVELEPMLGRPGDLDALIADLHERSMRLVVDMVVNHAGYGAALVDERPTWFHGDEDCDAGPEELVCPLSGLPDLAQEDAEVATYLTELSVAWARRFDFDGVRMDTAKHVPLPYFADHWLPAMDADRDRFTIAEVFDESTPAVFGRYLDAGFDSAFNFPLRRALVDVFARDASTDRLGDTVAEAVSHLGIEGATRMVSFLANHDVPRWVDEVEDDVSDGERAERYRMALVALFTLPGIPQLYAGDELGLRGRFPANRRDMPAWAWRAEDRVGDHPEAVGDPAELFELTRELISLRREHPALSVGGYAELWRQGGGPPVFAFLRSDGAGSLAVVAFNNGDEPVGPLPLPIADNPGIGDADRARLADGVELEDLLGAGVPSAVTLADGHLPLSLPPRSAAVYALR